MLDLAVIMSEWISTYPPAPCHGSVDPFPLASARRFLDRIIEQRFLFGIMRFEFADLLSQQLIKRFR